MLSRGPKAACRSTSPADPTLAGLLRQELDEVLVVVGVGRGGHRLALGEQRRGEGLRGGIAGARDEMRDLVDQDAVMRVLPFGAAVEEQRAQRQVPRPDEGEGDAAVRRIA